MDDTPLFWSAPAERSDDGALTANHTLATRAQGVSRCACHRSPQRANRRFGVRRLVGAFTLADLSASKGAFSAQLLAKRGRFGEFDADKSPRKSGDESPHSKIASGK